MHSLLAQPAHLGSHRRTQAHTLALSWPPSQPCRRPQLVVSQCKAAVSWVCARVRPAPPPPPFPRAPCCAYSCVVSWPYSALYRNTAPAGQSSQVTIHYCVLRHKFTSCQSKHPSRYNCLYRDTLLPSHQACLSQHTKLYCNTVFPAAFSLSVTVYCNTQPAQTIPFCHNIVDCIAIQSLSLT